MESVSTPRISANMLDSYVGQNVIIVGKVMQLRGESAVLDANGQVNAILNRESHLMAGNGAQIIGKVNPDSSVKVYNAVDLGSNVVAVSDFQVAQSVVDITHQYKGLFVYDNANAGSLLPASSPIESESQQPPSLPSSSFSQSHRHHYHHHLSQTPPRPASAASYYSSSSEVYSSSSSMNDELSQLAIQSDVSPASQSITTQDTQSSRLNYQNTSRDRPTTAESNYSSSSEALSSTQSFTNELSQHVIDYNEPSPSQLVISQNRYSSSSESFSSISSLDNELSRLPVEHDQPSSSQFTTAESYQSRKLSVLRTPSPHPTTAASYYSSSSEVSDSSDGVFSQPVIKEETPHSSQSTTQDTQPSRPKPQSEESLKCSNSSIPTTLVYEQEVPSPVYGSPSSTGKLSNGPPSPIQSPALSTSSSLARSPRLYRTRSGNLANVAELRQRKEREEELLNTVMTGIVVLGETSSRRSIAMKLDENGRWRINSIQEPWGP
ncbi:replication factor A protein 3-domain-containing protein [Xylaria digitata]|nr:replication factor A protein 3-domain-containing protein [Xylaria digitata]